MIPLSDGTGEIVDAGESMNDLKAGDCVIGNFFQDWVNGPIDDKDLHSAFGGGISGTLTEYFVLKAHNIPALEGMSYEEATTLSCAAITARHAWASLGDIKSGDMTLLLGAGGAFVFSLQSTKPLSANGSSTSSNDEKLERVIELGANHLINYKDRLDRDQVVLEVAGNKWWMTMYLKVDGANTFEKLIT